jgi:AcrR family transcriptional regulator
VARIKHTTGTNKKAAEALLEKRDRLGSASDPEAAPTLPLDRPSRARIRTRQKLIDAAHRVIGLKGVESTTINEITEEADVGLGSFYNYFTSKDELVRVVFADRVEELGRIFDTISSSVSDPALVVSHIQRLFLEKVRLDAGWGWFAIHAELALQLMDRAFNERARRDLQRGVDQGRFTLENVDIAARLIMATLLTLMRAILEDRAEPQLIIESVALQLRMLGVPGEEASRIVRQPLPDIAQSFLK